jgi:hypothetical protein
MPSSIQVWSAALAVFAACGAPDAFAADACVAQSGAKVVPLVELYTSEGCSSCPPADRWLSRQLSNRNANWLAFHVDYWDAIGWPDRFASPQYTQRQNERVRMAGDRTVYTPQVMVGRDVRIAWNSPMTFSRALKTDAGADAGVSLKLRLDASKVRLDVARIGAATAPATVWLARYVDGQTSRVRAGENRGVTLRHDRVVRQLWGPWQLGAAPAAQVETLPPQSGAWGLVAFVEDAGGRTLQSLALPAGDCAAVAAR